MCNTKNEILDGPHAGPRRTRVWQDICRTFKTNFHVITIIHQETINSQGSYSIVIASLLETVISTLRQIFVNKSFTRLIRRCTVNNEDPMARLATSPLCRPCRSLNIMLTYRHLMHLSTTILLRCFIRTTIPFNT